MFLQEKSVCVYLGKATVESDFFLKKTIGGVLKKKNTFFPLSFPPSFPLLIYLRIKSFVKLPARMSDRRQHLHGKVKGLL